jgi:hypothetical protein
LSSPTFIHIGVLLLLWVLFFWRFAAPNPADRWALADGDFTQQFGVFRDLVYRAVVQGRAPLWTGCLLAGYPLHADPQTQLFYLPAWITYSALRLGGWGHYPIEALTLEGLAHYLFISLTLYFFLRGEVQRPAAVLLGAAVFTYSGYLTGFPVLQTATVETLAWLAPVLICLRRLAVAGRHASRRWLAGAALALALAYFGGHPQTFVYVGGIALAYLAFRARAAGVGWGLLAGWAGLLAALTAALSAVQLVPSLQFISPSTRQSIPFEEAGRGFNFVDTSGFILPGLTTYWHYLYIGILPLALAVYALVAGRNSKVLFWAALALAGLWLSFGSKAGLYTVVYWLLPPFRLFRGQEHFSLVTAFSLAMLAALGADRLLGSLAGRAWGGILVLVAVLDLFAVNRGANAEPPFEAYAYTPLVDPIRAENGFFRVQDDFQLPGHAGCGYGFRQVEGITPYRLVSYQTFLDRVPEAVRWQLLGVRYVATWRQGLAAPFPVATAAEGPSPPGAPNQAGVTKVYRLEGVAPRRAFLVPDVVGVDDNEQAYAALAAPEFNPFATALVLASEGLPFVSSEPAGEVGNVAVLADAPGDVSLQTTAGAPGMLVLSEAWYPGWEAAVDGVAAPVARVDGALMGVPVRAGEHSVRFTFRPPALLWGGVISGFSLLAAALLISLPTRRQMQP